MAVLAGIDEAGYGPILGPLVVSSTAFRVPDKHADGDLWNILSEAVTQRGERTERRIRVADSKKVYERAKGLASLEKHLLAFQSVMTEFPARLSAFARTFSSLPEDAFDAYPWYAAADPLLPRAHPTEDIRLRARMLKETLTETGCAFCAARFEAADALAFDREITETANKAMLLSRRLARLLMRLWEDFGAEGVRVRADRQGGRKWYGAFLTATFPSQQIETIMETDECSAYRIEGAGKRMSVSFETRCDQRHLPTALASMLSKYVREVFLEMLNDYWCARVPDLKRTAGYYTDGKRFLGDIEQARRKEGIPLSLMVRCR